MRKLILLFILILATVKIADAQTPCTVYGTVYDWGLTTTTRLELRVVEVTHSTLLVRQFGNKTHKSDKTTGAISFTLPQGSNAKMRANFGGFDGTVFFAIPSSDSVALTSLMAANVSTQSQGGFVLIREDDGTPSKTIQGLNDSLIVEKPLTLKSGTLQDSIGIDLSGFTNELVTTADTIFYKEPGGTWKKSLYVDSGVAGGNSWSDPVDSDILPTGADNTYDLGSAAASFKDGNFQGTLEAGTLTEGGTGVYNITQSDAAYQPLEATLTDIASGSVSGEVITFVPSGLGGLTNYDASFGDTDGAPTYGNIRIGDATISRSSFTSGSLDIGGAILVNNVGALDVGNNPGIEWLLVENGSTIRLAVPESGAGNATAMIRSVTIAGPSTLNNNIVTGDTWTTNDSNLDFDTGTTGSDLFVQDDLEVGGIVYADSILEEISAAGVRIDGVLLKDGTIGGISLATSAAIPLLLTNGQLVNIALTSQTVGATTLTIPDFASVVDEFTFKTKAQTMSNKTFVAPALGTPVSGVATNLTGTAVGLTAGNVTTNANLTGEVTSTGNAAVIIESFLEDGGASEIAVTAGMMNAGTSASSSTFWRGDNTWSVPAGSGDVSKVGTPVDDEIGVWTGDGTLEGDTNFQWDGSTLTTTGAGVAFDFQNTTDASTNQLGIFRGGNRGTPADNDSTYFSFFADTDAPGLQEFARFTYRALDETNTTKDADLFWSVMVDNTLTRILRVEGAGIDVVGAGVFSGALSGSNLSGTNTGDEPAADLTTPGIIEIATGAETNTGTDATRAVSPDGLDDWTGSAQVATLGTIATGVWNGTAVTYANLNFSNNIVAGDIATSAVETTEILDNTVAVEDVQPELDNESISYSIIDTVKAGDLARIFEFNYPVTIDSVVCNTDAGTVTFNIEHRAHTTPRSAGTDILTADIVADAFESNSTFDDNTIPANRPLYHVNSAVSGGADRLDVTIFYKID